MRTRRLLVLCAILGLAGFAPAYDSDGPTTVARLFLNPEPGFGKGVNWDKVLGRYPGPLSHREAYKNFVRLADGRFVVVDSRTYNFLLFDSEGRFVKRLWKSGRRKPDDLSIYNRPEWLALWKNKFLFVSELGLIRVFDLQGKEIRSAVIDHPVECLVPLGESRVAVAGNVLRENMPTRYFAAVFDMDKGTETVVMDSIERRPEKGDAVDSADGTKKVSVAFPHAQIRPFVRPAADGGFLAGFTNWPEIEVYDATGKPVRTLMIKTERARIESDWYRDWAPQGLALMWEANKKLPPESKGRISTGGANIPPPPADSAAPISKAPHIALSRRMSRMPIQNAPYFYNLYNDPNGNLIVFYFPSQGDKPVFQVYAPDGTMKGEFIVETGDYILPFSPGGAGAVFADGLFAMAEKKGAAEPSLKLMKFNMTWAKSAK